MPVKTTPAHHDITIRDHGSLILFTPETPEASAWVKENVDIPDWAWWGGGFAVEPRYAVDLLIGLNEAGLTTKTD